MKEWRNEWRTQNILLLAALGALALGVATLAVYVVLDVRSRHPEYGLLEWSGFALWGVGAFVAWRLGERRAMRKGHNLFQESLGAAGIYLFVTGVLGAALLELWR